MADAADLKSADGFLLYGFESRLRQFLGAVFDGMGAHLVPPW